MIKHGDVDLSIKNKQMNCNFSNQCTSFPEKCSKCINNPNLKKDFYKAIDNENITISNDLYVALNKLP